MKYKEGLAKWYFWAIVAFFFLLRVIPVSMVYGRLFISEYLGMFIGSFIWSLIIYSIAFFLKKIINIIKKKVTKR